jgi:hypothetical protein
MARRETTHWYRLPPLLFFLFLEKEEKRKRLLFLHGETNCIERRVRGGRMGGKEAVAKTKHKTKKKWKYWA